MKFVKSIFAAVALAFVAACTPDLNPWGNLQKPEDTPSKPDYEVWDEPTPPAPPKVGKATGYTYKLAVNPVGWTHDGDYYFYIYAPGVEPTADNTGWVYRFECINEPGLGVESLCGEYTIQGSPGTTPWLMDNGWDMGPTFGGGTSYVDETGDLVHITGGKIIVSSCKNKDGKLLIEFNGEDLTTSKGSFDLKLEGTCDEMLEPEVGGGNTGLTPSGYTIHLLGVTDATIDGNGTVAEGMSKYYVYVFAPEVTPEVNDYGQVTNHVAHFEFVNKAGMTLAELAGDYTAASYPGEPFLMDNGYVIMPGWAGGSCFLDENGTMQYIDAGGVVSMKVVKSRGADFYTISAEEVNVTSADQTKGTASLMIENILEPDAVLGGDDAPQASGYSVMLAAVTDATIDGNGTVAEGMSKYDVYVFAPEVTPEVNDYGQVTNHVAHFEFVNKAGMTLAELAGDYTAASYPGEPFLMDNGYVIMPGWAGGSCFLDENGTMQYIDAGGVVSLKVDADASGNPLFSFTSGEINVTTATQEKATASCSIQFASEMVISE